MIGLRSHGEIARRPGSEKVGNGAMIAGTLLVLAVLVWQGVVSAGAPDPTRPGLSSSSMIFSSGVLVLREGLEAVLVLATITAGLAFKNEKFWKAVVVGVVVGLLATALTWVGVVAAISAIHAPMYDIQAATGLLAVVVLLVVMNWFVHKIYWTGWIGHHSSRRKKLLESGPSGATLIGFAALGFTAIYREGFEIVLFLQDLRLKAGDHVVLGGACFGLALTLIVAALTFVAHRKLPYKKMLVLTGMLLGMVLVVMIGESAQELQQANWIPTTRLNLSIPDWAGVWFAAYPTVQTLAAQVAAVVLVAGSYGWIRLQVLRKSGTLTGSAS